MIVLRNKKIIEIPYNQTNIDKYKSSDNLLRHARVNKKTGGIMLVERNRLVGYCGWEGNCIIALEVCKDYRGNGYGDKLIERAINSGCTRLTVNRNNIIAINLYKKHGFRPSTIIGNRIDMEL